MNDTGAALSRCFRERSTGAVEWQSGKKRRLFFFEEGELVLAQSNLKSESIDRVAADHPDVDAAGRRWVVLSLRVSQALREEEGDVTLHAGAAAPRREPGDLVKLLFEAAERLPPVPDDAWPRTVTVGAAWLARLPIPPPVIDYLLQLDGTRSLDDVVGFGPAHPDLLARALAVAAAIGSIELGGHEVTSATVVTGGAAPAGIAGDISGLIREELGEAAAPPADPIRARFGPLLKRVRDSVDHFSTLGVTWEDSPETLRRAYFSLARELHPDGFSRDPPEVREVAGDLFDRIRAAWEVLGEPTAREAYIARVIRGEKTEDEKAMDKVQSILEAETDFRRGKAEFTAGRIALAHELFVKATAAVPEESEFAAYAGYTTFRVNEGRDAAAADEGVRKLREALHANERLDAAWVLLGMVHRARGAEETARNAFISALKLNPSNPDALREMKRNQRERDQAAGEQASGGIFSRLFGRKPAEKKGP